MFMVRTQYKTTYTGAGRIVAKAGGRQATVPYDHEHSADWNHGNAAGVLLLRTHYNGSGNITHKSDDNGHVFLVHD